MANIVVNDFGDDPNSMSIIPYNTNRDVVLRHAGSVVYFDPESRQLILRDDARDVDTRSPARDVCSTCGQPYPNEVPDNRTGSTSAPEDQPSFINHDYFRILAKRIPGSDRTSGPPSPRRRTIQPVRSRLSGSGEVPPPDAELLSTAPAPPSLSHGISESAFAPQYFERFFVIEKELGKGGRGVVLLVKHVLDGVSLGHFACKRVPIGDDHTWLEKVLVEVQALQALSHENLVSYRHVWLEDYQLNNFGPSVPCAFILQQYCNGGDLHNYVCGSAQVQVTTQDLKDRMRRKSRGESDGPRKLSEPKKLLLDEIYQFFRDITAGLRFLHLNGFIHRDLKPSNCLLHTVGGETRVLVSDFGEVQYENAKRKSTGATGTISYCAPEVLQRETPEGPFGNFTFKSDVFSLGMILHFLCFANLPYQHADVLYEEREDLTRLRAEIIAWAGFDDHRKLRPELPPQLYGFLKRLLSIAPEGRPTADEVSEGIRLRSLDSIQESRRRNSVSPEELTPGRRIQKLGPTTPATSPSRGTSSDCGQNAMSPSLRRRTMHRESSSFGSAIESPPDASSGDEDAGTGVGMERSFSAPASSSNHPHQIDESMALVPKSTTPAPSPTLSPTPTPNRRHQYLLPPPQPTLRATSFAYIRAILLTDITSPIIRTTILAVKLLTALQPCISQGMNASVLYPLLALAVTETAIHPLGVWKAGLGFLLHSCILWYALARAQLCDGGRYMVD